MKKEDKVMYRLSEILNHLQELDSVERKWILDVQIPKYFCSKCGYHFIDCECEEF